MNDAVSEVITPGMWVRWRRGSRTPFQVTGFAGAIVVGVGADGKRYGAPGYEIEVVASSPGPETTAVPETTADQIERGARALGGYTTENGYTDEDWAAAGDANDLRGQAERVLTAALGGVDLSVAGELNQGDQSLGTAVMPEAQDAA